MKSLKLALAAGLVASSLSSQARADDCHDVAKLKKDGNAAFGRAHYEDAITAYSRAYACDKDSSLLFNMAKAQLQIGRYVAGLDSIRRFQAASSELPTEVRAAARSVLADLLAHVGTITVNAPVGASVSIDDREIGPAPVDDVEVAAGSVTVHVVAPGHAPVDRKVLLQRGKHEVVLVSFASTEPVAPIVPGSVEPASSGRPIHPLVWAGAGVAGVGLLVGATAGALSLSKTSALKKLCPQGKCTTNIDAEKSKANTLANVSNVGFVFSAAGAVLGGVGIGLTFRHASTEAHVSLQPTGMSVEGTF